MAEKKEKALLKPKASAIKKELKLSAVKSAPNRVKSNRLKLLITIVNRRKAEYFCDLIQSFDVNMQIVTIAKGTADARMLDLLGLNESDKVVIFSVIQENKVPDALHTLDEKFNAIKGGKGIACTVPLTSVIGTLIYGFLSNNKSVVKEGK